MASDIDNKLLSAFADALSILIKEHTATKIVFDTVKSKFKKIFDVIHEKSGKAIDIVQTGSSSDDLHMCVNTTGYAGKKQFVPPTDFDFMLVYCQILVEDFTHIKCTDPELFDLPEVRNAIHESNSAFLMINSEHLGYVRLLVTDKGRQILHGKKPASAITESGFFQSTAFKKDHTSDPHIEIVYQRVPSMEFTPSGPALTSLEHEEEGFTYDFVYAFPCKQWPRVAERWNKRPRDAKWPSKELIDGIMKDGCAVVPVGFYTSPNQDVEWRLSFNLSEGKLSHALTKTQRLCYCIVKLLIKTSLSESAILSSYMVKNLMFWFCEQQYGAGQWEDDQVGERILQLIDYVITALGQHNIPHYILPWNNLIRHRNPADVQSTLDDVRRLRMSLFSTLFSVCLKMDVFEVQKDTKGTLSAGNEVQCKLTLFTAFVQAMAHLAILSHANRDLAVRCFRVIVSLNTAAKCLIKTGSHLFTTTSLIELLKPFAIQFMQAGDVDKALSFYTMMLLACMDDVKASYLEAFTNIACLEAVKLNFTTNKHEKEQLKESANKNFMVAISYMKDSPSLYLAYGNFLKESNLSVLKAVEQYRTAISLEEVRPDDDALIQITLPDSTGATAKMVYMSGQVVSYYSLINTLVDIQELYEARRLVKTFQKLVSRLNLKFRKDAQKLCYHAYMKVGLHVKAGLVLQKCWNEL